jgi:predicted SnoaL-like aldol condensation-catalyzing enzyme
MTLEQSKTAVVNFLRTAFMDGKPEEAVADHVGDRYIQHNPEAPDGPEGFIGFVHRLRERYPQRRLDIKRVIAEGDMVVLHSHMSLTPGRPGHAVADFFRLEDGKVVEHWDVVQEIPETSANTNGMF